MNESHGFGQAFFFLYLHVWFPGASLGRETGWGATMTILNSRQAGVRWEFALLFSLALKWMCALRDDAHLEV